MRFVRSPHEWVEFQQRNGAVVVWLSNGMRVERYIFRFFNPLEQQDWLVDAQLKCSLIGFRPEG